MTRNFGTPNNAAHSITASSVVLALYAAASHNNTITQNQKTPILTLITPLPQKGLLKRDGGILQAPIPVELSPGGGITVPPASYSTKNIAAQTAVPGQPYPTIQTVVLAHVASPFVRGDQQLLGCAITINRARRWSSGNAGTKIRLSLSVRMLSRHSKLYALTKSSSAFSCAFRISSIVGHRSMSQLT